MKLRNGKRRLNSRKIFQMMRYMREESNHSGERGETSSLNTFQFSLDKVLGKCSSGNQPTAATGDYNCTIFLFSFFIFGFITHNTEGNFLLRGQWNLALLPRAGVDASSLEALNASRMGPWQPELVGGNQPTAGGWDGWAVRSLPAQTFMWFYKRGK